MPVTPTATDTPGPTATPTATGTPPAGRIFYVAPDGDDGNPGTILEPWRSIQHAADSVTGGDAVYIRAGTYNERVALEYRMNAAYITFAAYANEEVILDGTGVGISWGGGLFHVWQMDYIRVVGLRVQNSNGAGIYVAYSDNIEVIGNQTYDTVKSGVGIWGCNNVIVESNDIELACNPHEGYGQSEENITISASSYVVVRDNYVHDGPVGLNQARAGGEGINMKDGSHHMEVSGNVVCRTDKLAYGIDAWMGYTHDIEFYGNVAHDTFYGFIVSSEQGGSVENAYIYNNIAYNIERAGLAIPWWSGTTDGQKTNIQFVNNTVYNSGYGFQNQSSMNENVLVRNNIFSQNDVGVAGIDEQFTVDYNLFYGSEAMGTDPVIGDPLFVDPAGADFHLQNGSPAIDAGSSLDAPDTDFDGISRPQGNGYDIGAYERE